MGLMKVNLEQNILQVPIDEIIPNRFQPRLNFDDRGLEELASSIKQHGIIQPLVLRRVNDKYEIIAGERRYKAATMAGLSKVPAVIADVDDNKSAEVAIVENVQRRDLSAIEEARSYKNLLDKGYLTQAELAKKMGLSQSAIANKLRLLNLDEEVQQALIENKISERHARSLLVLPTHEEQRKWLKRIINERMTVRELDNELKKLNEEANKEEEDETDVPLVKNIDIDAIRKQATEIPSVNEESDIARKLREIEREKMFNPDVIPVDQATNDSKGNFFNFLENEKVNMNMEEPILKTPAINIDLPKASIPEEKKEETIPESIEEKIDAVSNFEPMGKITEEREPVSPNPSPVLNTNFGSPVKEDTKTTNEEVFDPVNLIDTLDPDYEEKQEEKLGIDLKTAINTVRELKDALSERGFNISLEETDLNDVYQFIIKVKKD
ncbi:MAG TPA: ParB/RepB/Spo0J family partition protein [Candidatus Caccenecus avistercoris]|nr:ParB/RepB/Spo0J family partition protein [Candidatus Caccenecus avistercoris]